MRSLAFGAALGVGVWIGAKVAADSFWIALAGLVLWITAVLVVFGILDRRRS
jgi:hypothetical protein